MHTVFHCTKRQQSDYTSSMYSDWTAHSLKMRDGHIFIVESVLEVSQVASSLDGRRVRSLVGGRVCRHFACKNIVSIVKLQSSNCTQAYT